MPSEKSSVVDTNLKVKEEDVISSNEVRETPLNDQRNKQPKREEYEDIDSDKQLVVFHISKNSKVSFNKTLILLRIALFLWYGAGNVPMSYHSVFIKQKGLSLVQYTSIFSVTFVFQFLTAFLSGIVADKIGNTKPVLLFNILATMLMILTSLLSPGINVCDLSANDNLKHYGKNSTNNFTNNYRPFNETLQNGEINIKSYNESNVKKDSLSEFASPNITALLCADYGKNCTHTNTTIFDDKCESRNRGYLILYVISTIILFSCCSSVYRLMDATVMSLAQKYNTSFGYERFFAISGDLVITFIIGIVFNAFTSGKGDNNYQSVYWASLCISCFVAVAVYNIETQINPPSQNMWKNGFSLLRNINNLTFIIVIFILGTFHCFYQNFILWFLEYINASPVVMGLQQTVHALYGLPFFLTSKWWLNTFGSEKLLITAFLGYVVYGIGYSFLYNPWWCLLIEISTALFYHLLWVAVVVHCHHIAPKELVSTVIATSGAIHFGIGRSSGTVTGGLLMDAVGPRATFRIFSILSTVAAILYSAFLYCRRSKKTNNEL